MIGWCLFQGKYGWTEVGTCEQFFRRKDIDGKKICANCEHWWVK